MLNKIALTICNSCKVDCVECDYVNNCVWLPTANSVYTTHVKPLEDALAAAKERERVMVEALEEIIFDIEDTDECRCDGAKTIARAALVRVKEEQDNA